MKIEDAGTPRAPATLGMLHLPFGFNFRPEPWMGDGHSVGSVFQFYMHGKQRWFNAV